MADGRVTLAFLADVQIGCMATFSGLDEEDLRRFEMRGMTVRSFPRTTSLEWDEARFRAAVAELNRLRPELAVLGGDMIDRISEPDQLEVFRSVAATCEVPLHYAPGNHDICPDAAVPTEESRDWYRSVFGAEHITVEVPLGGGSRLTVITVNSCVLDQPRRLPGAFEAEMEWLEAELGRSRAGPVVVVSHHPPFVERPDEDHNYWNLPAERRRPFLDLLCDAGVELLLCGHRHRNDAAEYRGLEIVTTAAVGFPLGPDPSGFRLVEVDASGISHAYYPLADPGWDAIGGPPDGV